MSSVTFQVRHGEAHPPSDDRFIEATANFNVARIAELFENRQGHFAAEEGSEDSVGSWALFLSNKTCAFSTVEELMESRSVGHSVRVTVNVDAGAGFSKHYAAWAVPEQFLKTIYISCTVSNCVGEDVDPQMLELTKRAMQLWFKTDPFTTLFGSIAKQQEREWVDVVLALHDTEIERLIAN